MKHDDYLDFVLYLERDIVRGIPSILTGGIAVGLYAVPRSTGDVDLIVKAKRGWKGLSEFSLALLRAGFVEDQRKDHFLVDTYIRRFRMGKWKVDVHEVEGREFGRLLRNSVQFSWRGNRVFVISRFDLIELKVLRGNYQDLADVKNLYGRGLQC